jgi:hypothetical protein
MQPDRGFAFVSRAGDDGQDGTDTFAAPPRLLEDGRVLGPAVSAPREVRRLGGGRYGFFHGALYFSSSDGTDPRTNGRAYRLERPWPLPRRTAGLIYCFLAVAAISALRPWLLLASALRPRAGTGSPSQLSAAETSGVGATSVFDGVAVLVFCVTGVGLVALRGNGEYPFVWLGSDAAQLASFAAARDHPDLFENDTLLADPVNHRFYASVHIPLLQWLTRLSGDYGTSFLWLLGPTVVLQLLGFYLLGRALFADRFWALLLAFATSGTTSVFGPGEFWGLWPDCLPRNLYQAVLPFLLLAVLRWRAVPAAWPLLMAGLGASMYLHPVSAPVWGAAAWLGLASEHWQTSWRRVSRLLLAGFVFVLVAGPLLLGFSRQQRPSSPALAEQASKLQDRVYGFEGSSHPLSQPVLLELSSQHGVLLVASLLALAILWKLRPDRPQVWRQTLAWLVGILLVSVGLPLLIQIVAANPHTTNTQRILVRNLRFLFPMLLVQCVWALAVLERACRRAGTRLAVLACGLYLLAVWLQANPPMLWPQEWARRTGWGRSRDPDTLAILLTIKEKTPPTARLLSFDDARFEPSAIRYFSLRSLAYCYKDVGPLGHTNDRALLEWGDAQAKYEDLRHRERDASLLEAAVAFARELEADHLLVHAPPSGVSPRGVVEVYANQSYALFRLEGTSPGSWPRERGAAQRSARGVKST